MVAALYAVTPAQALTFNISYDPALVTAFGANFAALQADMNYVTNLYSTQVTNNVTLTYTLFADPTPGALAASGSTHNTSQV